MPDYLRAFAQHVLPNYANVIAFSQAKDGFPSNVEGLSTAWNQIHTPMRTHPVDYAFHVLADRHEYRIENKNYLKIRPYEINIKRFKLPNKYACICTTASEPCKALPPEVLNQIADFVIQKGYTPVFLGKQEAKAGYKDFAVRAKVIDIDYSKGVNLVDKTSMLEAAKVIHYSAAFVGMDSGLVHLAGCTNSSIIAGYSLVDPIHVAPIRSGSQTWRFTPIEPDDNIPHRYHQTYTNFKKGDYREFPYAPVIGSLSIDKWTKALENVL